MADERSTDPDFIRFRAETEVQLAHFREMFARLMPLHEQRSGDRQEIHAIKEGMAEIKGSVAAVEVKVDKITDGQRRMIAVMFALQVLGGLLVWLMNAGVLKFGAPP